MEKIREQAETVYNEWLAGLEKDEYGRPGWGVTCAELVILERILADYMLDVSRHTTNNGTQLRGQGNPLGRKILARWGIAVLLPRGEFGRTTRSGPRAAERLLRLLEPLKLEELSQEERNSFLLMLQEILAHVLANLALRKKIDLHYIPTLTTERFIGSLLEKAVDSQTSGALAQHLVGAKLELRFPGVPIENHPLAAADIPTGRSGDFSVGNTIFHVTVTPQDAVYDKCEENLNDGKRVYLLVAGRNLEQTREKARSRKIEDYIVIKSIESFVGQNIDELATFSTELLEKRWKELEEIFNRRVRQVERNAPELIILIRHPIVTEYEEEVVKTRVAEPPRSYNEHNLLDLLSNKEEEQE